MWVCCDVCCVVVMNVLGLYCVLLFVWQVFVVYVVLIVYVLLYLFEGWVVFGIGLFDYLFVLMQCYVMMFDVVMNVFGYLLFGVFGVFVLYLCWCGVVVMLIVGVFGVLLLGVMEVLQIYLLMCVVLNFDFGVNVFGVLLGVVFVVLVIGVLFDCGVLCWLCFVWLEVDGLMLLLFVVLWLFVIVFLLLFLFGIGDWFVVLWECVDVLMQDVVFVWLLVVWCVSEWFEWVDGWLFDLVWEVMFGGLMLFVVLVIVLFVMCLYVLCIWLLVVLVVVMFVLKVVVIFMQLVIGFVVVWVMFGVWFGIEFGFVVVFVVLCVLVMWCVLFVVFVLLVGVVFVNLLLVNLFFDFMLLGWWQGCYVYFNSFVCWFVWIWFYVVLIWFGQCVEYVWLLVVLCC